MTAPALPRCQTNGPDCDLAADLRERRDEAAKHPDAFLPGTWAYACFRHSNSTYRRHVERCRQGDDE